MGYWDVKYPSLPVDHSAFQVIDTPQKAYLIGFLLADGCVIPRRPGIARARITLRIKAEDIKVCRMAQQIAGGNLRLIEGGYRAEWDLNSDPIAADLAALGITPRKSLTAALAWNRIPTRLHGAVLAGLIDGDGNMRFCTGKHNRRAEISLVTASAALRDQLLKCFPFFKLAVVPANLPRRSELYRLGVEANRALLKALIQTVYDDLPFGILDRKQPVLDAIRAQIAEQDAYDERMGHVAQMKEAGATIDEIALKLGTSRRPIMERLWALGVDSRRVVFTEEDRREMLRMHSQGMSLPAIHAAFQKGTEQAVRYHLVKMGCLKKRSPMGREKLHPEASEIVTDFQAGKPAYKISEDRGIGKQVVSRVLREAGISLKSGSPQKLTEAQTIWAAAEVARGRTQRAVAEELGVSGTLIRLRINQLPCLVDDPVEGEPGEDCQDEGGGPSMKPGEG